MNFCYTWSDADVTWNNVEITWRESCILQKVIGNGSFARSPHSKLILRNRIKRLKKEEKQILISLITRVVENDDVIQTKINKYKNNNIKINLKNVELVLKEAKKIKLEIFIK